MSEVYHRSCKRCGEHFTVPRPKLGRTPEFCSEDCRRNWRIGNTRAAYARTRRFRLRLPKFTCACGNVHACQALADGISPLRELSTHAPSEEVVQPAPEKQEASNG